MSLITDQLKEEMRDTKRLAGWGETGEGWRAAAADKN